MGFVFFMISLFLLLDLLVWLKLDQRLRTMSRPRIPRWVLGLFMGSMLAMLGTTLVGLRRSALVQEAMPKFIPAAIYIWHFLIVLPTLIVLVVADGVRGIARWAGRQRLAVSAEPPPLPSPGVPEEGEKRGGISRRNFLVAGAMAIPPLATVSLSSVALSQIGQFRVRRFDLALPTLPPELSGLTLAVVADVHTGVFSTPKMLNDIADCANNLRADLILLDGDLINISHADLPSALDMVMRLDCPAGVYMVQGNHDVIEGPDQFDDACRARGVQLLVDQVQTIRARGVPLQLLGTRWRPSESQMVRSVNTVADARDPDLFPIVMAHHPHCWDQAVERGLPLVISGHTHGGQIMLTDKIGGGPLRFRYWTGLYQRQGSNLIVSNGVGNWFPLRVNAPAEILHITLRTI